MPRTINENRPYYKEYQLYNKINNDNVSMKEEEGKVRNRIKQRKSERTNKYVSNQKNITASYFSYQSIHIVFLDHYEEESCDIDKYHYYRDDYH